MVTAEADNARERTVAPAPHAAITLTLAPVMRAAHEGHEYLDHLAEHGRRIANSANFPSQVRDFFNVPFNFARDVAGIFERNENQETGEMNVHAARREFGEWMQTKIPGLTERQIDAIFNVLWDDHLNQHGHAATGATIRGQREGNTELRDAGLRVGHAVSLGRTAIGQGTVEDNDRRFLLECCKGLDAQQQEDLLRAAVQHGFSAASVFGTAGQLQFGARQQEVMTMLTEATARRMEELMDGMRTDHEDREKYDRRLAELGALVGPRRAKQAENQVEEHARETDELIAKAIADQVRLSAEMHGGNFNIALRPTRPRTRAAS